MKKVILHIGHGKTGSSYLQSSLALSRDFLYKVGYDYPNHPSLLNAKNGNITSGNISIDKYWDQYILKKVAQSKCENIIFSSEHLFGQAVNSWIQFSQLNKFVDLKLILFIRDPLEHLASLYTQVVKRKGYYDSIDKFSEIYKVPSKILQVIKQAKVENIEIEIINYSNVKNNVIESLAKSISPNLENQLLKPKNKTVNRSLTSSELFLQIEFNKLVGKEASKYISDALCDNLPHIKSDKPQLRKDTYNRVVKRIQNDVLQINKLVDREAKLKITKSYLKKEHEINSNLIFSEEQISILVKSMIKQFSLDHD